MPKVTAQLNAPPPIGFRAQQVIGMFDLNVEAVGSQSFSVEVPDASEAWQIGAIVGPSGSGKSTIAREAFGNAVCAGQDWPREDAVVDCIAREAAADSIHTITGTFAAVGFSSPPAWIRPYHLLSTGEQFRCDLARALLSDSPLIVFDEFTSVVDRTVAKTASAAVAKAIRSGRIEKRLVAVSCHTDMLPWLAPDWRIDMTSGKLDWGRLRREPLELEVVGCRQSAWRLFAAHHYLASSLPRSATCFMALHGNTPVAFCASAGMMSARGQKRIARIVTLPDWQGIGIGSRLLDRVAEAEASNGFRVNLTTSHPAMVASCQRSPRWKCTGVKRHGSTSRRRCYGLVVKASAGRAVASFRYTAGDGNQNDE